MVRSSCSSNYICRVTLAKNKKIKIKKDKNKNKNNRS